MTFFYIWNSLVGKAPIENPASNQKCFSHFVLAFQEGVWDKGEHPLWSWTSGSFGLILTRMPISRGGSQGRVCRRIGACMYASSQSSKQEVVPTSLHSWVVFMPDSISHIWNRGLEEGNQDIWVSSCTSPILGLAIKAGRLPGSPYGRLSSWQILTLSLENRKYLW